MSGHCVRAGSGGRPQSSLVPAILGCAQTAVLHMELLMLSCLNDVEADFDEKKMGEHRPRTSGAF
jgi:hypothetical protein